MDAAKEYQKEMDFKKLSILAKDFFRLYGNPHMTIVINSNGIELLQGEMAAPFKE